MQPRDDNGGYPTGWGAPAPNPVRANAKSSAGQSKLAYPHLSIVNLDGAKTGTSARCSGRGTPMPFALQHLASLGTNGRGDQRGHGVKEDGSHWSVQSIGQPSLTRIL